MNFFSTTAAEDGDGSKGTSANISLSGTKRYTDVVVPKSDEEYYNVIKTSNTLVVVDFTASWCGPCQQIKPKFKQFAKEYNAEFLQVDVDEFENVAQEAKVTAMPTFHFYANGKKVAESVGADEKKIRQLIEKYVGKSKST